jgi:hypothetical protein
MSHGDVDGLVSRYGAITTTCYANCDNSCLTPVLNVGDFTCFLNKYQAGDSYANCDGSVVPPILTVNDYLCFLNSFAVAATISPTSRCGSLTCHAASLPTSHSTPPSPFGTSARGV